MGNVIRAYDAKIDDVDNATMSLVAKINTSDVDYYRTVIDAPGVRLDNYNKLGRPILWEHGKDSRRFTDPIGNARWIKNNGNTNRTRATEILAKPAFLKDDFSRQRFEWYRDEVIKGWSVNILPDAESASPPTREELRARPDWESAQLIYRSSTLAEFSGTVIPGNPMALTGERAAAVLDLVRRDLAMLPDDVMPLIEEAARTAPDNAEAVEELAEVLADALAAEPTPPALPDVAGARSIVEIARAMSAERKDMQRALRDEVVAMIDLLVYGRV